MLLRNLRWCSDQLQCQHLPGEHDHTHISEAMTAALSEWCIQLVEDVAALVTNNGSNKG